MGVSRRDFRYPRLHPEVWYVYSPIRGVLALGLCQHCLSSAWHFIGSAWPLACVTVICVSLKIAFPRTHISLGIRVSPHTTYWTTCHSDICFPRVECFPWPKCSLWPCLNGQCEKSCEIKGVAEKWLWWYWLMAKILITTIQVNLCCLILTSPRIGTKFAKIYAVNLYNHSHFLAPFWFHNFFHTGHFEQSRTFFLQPGCFWVDIII